MREVLERAIAAMEAMHRCDQAAGGRREWERRWQEHQKALDALKKLVTDIPKEKK